MPSRDFELEPGREHLVEIAAAMVAHGEFAPSSRAGTSPRRKRRNALRGLPRSVSTIISPGQHVPNITSSSGAPGEEPRNAAAERRSGRVTQLRPAKTE